MLGRLCIHDRKGYEKLQENPHFYRLHTDRKRLNGISYHTKQHENISAALASFDDNQVVSVHIVSLLEIVDFIAIIYVIKCIMCNIYVKLFIVFRV